MISILGSIILIMSKREIDDFLRGTPKWFKILFKLLLIPFWIPIGICVLFYLAILDVFK
jgi:hypothetical protein